MIKLLRKIKPLLNKRSHKKFVKVKKTLKEDYSVDSQWSGPASEDPVIFKTGTGDFDSIKQELGVDRLNITNMIPKAEYLALQALSSKQLWLVGIIVGLCAAAIGSLITMAVIHTIKKKNF